jgi:hypothetical protein
VIEFPEIDLDSDGDSFAPSPEDSPIVTTEIFEETRMAIKAPYPSILTPLRTEGGYLGDLGQ